MPETAELVQQPPVEQQSVEPQTHERASSYAEHAATRLNDAHIRRAIEINKRNPEYKRARNALKESMERATPEQKAKIAGIALLGEELWIDIQAQVRNPDSRHLLMKSVEMDMDETSEALKKKDVIETDYFRVGGGVHSVVAATKFRREHPGMGMLAVGENSVFGVSEHDAWILNTASLTPFGEEYEQAGFKANRDMNHLPGLPVQPREIDARLNPGNRSVEDAVKLANLFAHQNIFGVTLEGSMRKIDNPKFRYEQDIKDKKTGKITTVRFNDADIAAGFGTTDYEKVGDEETQDLIKEDLVKQEKFMEFMKTGKLPNGTNEIPQPAQILLGIEHGYPMFGYDSRDPMEFFRNKDILVVGAGGHTGLTMLMNLAHVNNSQPGFDLDPHGYGKIYAAGLKTPTRKAYLEAEDLPVYKPFAETLPVEEGGDGFVMPIGTRITALRRTEDGKIRFEYKDSKTGEMVSNTVDTVLITAGMKSSVDFATLFSEIPGFTEGTTKFSRIEEGNITQQLEGENIRLLGATAAAMEPRVVSTLEHQLMPGFKEGAASPVMVRTVLDTYNAARKIAEGLDLSNMVGPTQVETKKPHVHVSKTVDTVYDQLGNSLFVPSAPLGGNRPVSMQEIEFNAGAVLGSMSFPADLTELSIMVKPPERNKGFEICPNVACDNMDVASVTEKFCRDPMIQAWAGSKIEDTGNPVKISIPIVNGKLNPSGINLSEFVFTN